MRFTCACACDCVCVCVCVSVWGMACAFHKSFSLAPGVSAAWLKHAFSVLQVNASPLMPPLTHSSCVPLMDKRFVCFCFRICSSSCRVPLRHPAAITATPLPTWPPSDPSVNHVSQNDHHNPTLRYSYKQSKLTSAQINFDPPSKPCGPPSLSLLSPLSPLSICRIYQSTTHRGCFSTG